MKCPFCKKDSDKVIDSRLAEEGFAIRRRRECTRCHRRYTSYERREGSSLRVVKKDGSREVYLRDKIVNGINKACEKRPVSPQKIDGVIADLEREIHDKFEREVPSKKIGEIIMRELKKLDKVAYVRFASVYRDFKDIDEFIRELKPMLKNKIR
ncbi:MAG: transcriptional repressor NrdR [Planctomycetes bacterium]|nr:transcriptional repressor NrdR [Planctomycetota bacterium]